MGALPPSALVLALPRLHPRTIEAVKERADIVDVVGEHVVLKKKGREFVGVCPFHDDTSPSMTVSPAKQIYYCFSCGAGGNAIKFLMEFQRSGFSDVVLELARRYQLPVETLEGPQQERLRQQLSRRELLHRVLSLAAGWFQAQLRSPEGKEALGYLKDTRGLSEATLADFQLGYAPDRWDGLLSHLSTVEGMAPEMLEAAGLVVPRKGGSGFYDRFRHRVMVPIRDRQGRVIGFGGRSLDGSEPKYLNSPETEVFSKGSHLFALDRAADPIRRADQAVVVEGYFDAIALHAAGINQAVAALGTALSRQQITQLCRCCDSKRLVLNFDADRAGVRAAERAIGEVEHLALQGQVDLRVLQLPEGKDADEYLRSQGAGNYRALLDGAPLWLDWQIDQVLEGRDLSRSDQFQQAVAALVALLGKLPQSAVRSRYLQKVAERLSGGQARLTLQLENDLRQQVKGSAGMDGPVAGTPLPRRGFRSEPRGKFSSSTCTAPTSGRRSGSTCGVGSRRISVCTTIAASGPPSLNWRKPISGPRAWRPSVGGRMRGLTWGMCPWPSCSPTNWPWTTPAPWAVLWTASCPCSNPASCNGNRSTNPSSTSAAPSPAGPAWRRRSAAATCSTPGMPNGSTPWSNAWPGCWRSTCPRPTLPPLRPTWNDACRSCSKSSTMTPCACRPTTTPSAAICKIWISTDGLIWWRLCAPPDADSLQPDAPWNSALLTS